MTIGEIDHSNPITLNRFILDEKEIQGNADLSVLFSSIELACKVIASSVRRAGLTGLYGLDGSENSTGDQVKKLDVLSNDIFVNSLKFSTKIEVMVSEEEEKPIVVQSDSTGTKYCIAFDPLDGSSNIDCNVSTGTIFAIYQRDATSEGGYKDILQPGSKLVSAGYCMYGSSTQLVLTWGKGVHCFTLDPTIGAFILSQKDIRIPEEPKAIYSCNEGNYAHWDRATKAFVDECKTKPKPYAARYVGSMVSDIHRTILYGGIYLYPGSEKAKDGKLRLLYECNPMSFIMEQAGGASTTGTERVLDLCPTHIHQRSPIFLGCKRDVQRVIELYKQFGEENVMANQVDHSNPITLSRFILAEQEIQGNADLSVLFTSIELACKVIASSVRRAGLTGLYGLDGSENSTGDQVKKLDVLSNDIFVNSLKFSTKIEVMVSEEEEKPIVVQSDSTGTKYCIAFDPLDGSSNIDCNVSTGTIFAIYQRDATSEGGYKDILQPGSKLVSAGYCMYGSSTQLVLTWGKGVHCFTLDPTIGAFILSQKDIRIPEEPKAIYSCNEGNYAHWDRATKAFVDECKTKPKPYAARYVGSMVSDIHRTILYGGIYLYPGSEKAKDGKLRLLYECNPMSFIMEQAGGMSTTGTERILDLVPTDIHQRSPIFLGCKRDVERVIALYKEYNLA
ncbi:hypothetical protein JG687_00014734 [Phytophthora cactorum]|uniref:Fructose-1,6-bisphosphatase, cytosolic n=1 Tax=Phytophthora cactorum TaxID=29920 RepID=A0A8T1TW90_9STRA|nr:hypothetical protein JG687_00014734 [Phytophthora cactorum]